MKATIDDAGTVFTLINTFTTVPEDAPKIVESLRRFSNESASTMEGFVGASVHVSLDKTRVVNYVQWENETFFKRMFSDPRAIAHMREVRTFATAIDPVVYGVAFVISQRAETSLRSLSSSPE